MDSTLLCTAIGVIVSVIGTGVAVVTIIYQFFRNFKTDMNGRMDRLERRMDNFENKIISMEERFEKKVISIEERLFLILTGKNIEDAILEEQVKRRNLKTDP